MSSKPFIFDFLNYREFLKARVEYLKSENLFTVRDFTLRSGFRSTSYLTMIIDGRRNLMPESVSKVSKGLLLNSHESDFLMNLVKFDTAPTPEDKELALKKIMGNRTVQKARLLAVDQYEFYSNWRIVALYEILGLDHLHPKTSQLSQWLKTTPSKVSRYLQILERLQLIRKQNGHWIKQERALQTPPDVASVVVRNFHRVMLQKAKEALDNIPQKERNVTGLTIALSQNNYERLCNRIKEFRAEINAELSNEQNADKIYQLSFQLFPFVDLK